MVMPVVTVVMMAVPVAIVMVDHAMVMVVAAVLARRDDRGHGAERRDEGSGGCGVVVVTVVVTATGARRHGHGSQCNRGRGSNCDRAAGQYTHFRFPRSCCPLTHWGINVDLIKIDRRDNGEANYVFAM
jgi:hypothetical protein